MSIPSDLPFACACGTVSGALIGVGPRRGDRYVCYCADCRDFARYCGRQDTLDAAGGSSVYQTRAGRLQIDTGLDRLGCVNLAGKQLLRWFCGDCRTPLFNTMDSGKWPFLSIVTAGCDAEHRDAVLGPPRGSVFAKMATGPDVVTPPVAARTMIRRVVARLLADKLTGARKSFPLFDPATGAPIAQPRSLSDAEKSALGRA